VKKQKSYKFNRFVDSTEKKQSKESSKLSSVIQPDDEPTNLSLNLDMLQKLRDTRFTFEVEDQLSFEYDGSSLLKKVFASDTSQVKINVAQEKLRMFSSEPFNKEVSQLVVSGLDDLINDSNKMKAVKAPK
jgi:hypothetical protein